MTLETSTNAIAAITSSTSNSREIQRDARFWSSFSGMNYTSSLRLMQHPLAQGILGERIRARDLVSVLTEHPLLSKIQSGARVTHLGENGLWSSEQHPFGGDENTFLSVVLTAELLRGFTRLPEPTGDSYSYNLKHTAEEFFGEWLGEFSYISNGTAIWAGAVLGIPLAESNPGERSLNADFGLDPRQVEYARRMRGAKKGSANGYPKAHYHRPPGYQHLQRALEQYRLTGETPSRWNGVDENAEPKTSPFHEWLIAQTGSADMSRTIGTRETLAFDYSWGIRDGDHGIASQPEDLLTILHRVGADERVFDAARNAVLDWARTSPLSTGIRTELLDYEKSDHDGWGAGAGDTERYEYLCPCGAGKIVEEHENIPGFREHDVWITCSTCDAEWEFVPGRAAGGWRIRPRREAT